MLRIFVGVDKRQPLAFSVLATSIYRRASQPVAITPLVIDTLPIKRRGLTDFTFTRYLVPWLCDFQGLALFLDADILVNCDIAEVFGFATGKAGVYVSKGPNRFEWPAVMLFDCARCKILTPNYIENADVAALKWGEVGELPARYHHVVGYDEPRDDAAIVHFTTGIPEFKEVLPCEYARDWHLEKGWTTHTVSWLELMGKSVHAGKVLGRYL